MCKNIKISVIIPIYNMEKYIAECLNSIINQTLKEIEIICIDDCSNDNTLLLLENYKNKDNRIKLIQNTNNHGQGYSRNKGIKMAKGEYVTFVDSDDYISKEYLQDLYYTAKKYDSDIVSTLNIYNDHDKILVPSSYLETCKNDINNLLKNENNDGISHVSIINEKIGTLEYITGLACNKLYKRSFLIDNNLFFMNVRNAPEDEELYIRVLLNNPKTSYNHKAIYYYRQRKNSTMNSIWASDKIFFENAINTIDLMTNTINYCKLNNPNLLNYIYSRSFNILYERFTLFSDLNYQSSFYNNFYSFCKNINLDEKIVGIDKYNEYLKIINTQSYEIYILPQLIKRIAYLEKSQKKLINKIAWFIPFKKMRDNFRKYFTNVNEE